MGIDVRDSKLLSLYEDWLRSLLEELGPSQSRLLLICLMNSSSIDDPVKSLGGLKRDAQNLMSSLIAKKQKSHVVLISRKETKISSSSSSSVSDIGSINDLTDEEKKYINDQKQKILFPLFLEVFDEIAENSKGLLEKIYYNCRFWLKEKQINWPYVVVFFAVSFLVFYIVYAGWAEKPSINIEFNIGEIIGGILAGAGVFIAGKAYAQKTLLDRTDKSLKND